MFRHDFSVYDFDEPLPGFFNSDGCNKIENDNFQSCDDPMETESVCSTYKLKNDYPKLISDWTAYHIMDWILERYEKKKYCFEDLNLHHIRKLKGDDLSYLTESDWKQIDGKRSKWLYKRIQRVIRTLNKNSIYNNLQPRDNSTETDSVYNPKNKFPKSICEWNDRHIMIWILKKYEKKKYCFEDLNLHHIRKLKGSCLREFTEADWKQIDQNRSKWLYQKVKKLVETLDKNMTENAASLENEPTNSNNDIIQQPPKKARGRPRKQPKRKPGRCTIRLDATCSSQVKLKNSKEAVNPLKRKRGRPRLETPRNKSARKIGMVWEFLRDLLLDPQYCPSIICWEDYSIKKFRLLDAPEVARLWAQKRNKSNMTYRNFSRTLRHYYEHQIILSDPERFVYRFGINAKGIETDNPNFINGIPNKS